MADDYQISEIDNTGNNLFKTGYNNSGMSHPDMVRIAYYAVVRALCDEMRVGYWTERVDTRGNLYSKYESDSRLKAIECIMTLKNVMVNDIAFAKREEEVKKILLRVEELHKRLLVEQAKWIEQLPYNIQQELQPILNNVLHPKLHFVQMYLNEKINIYRELFELLESILGDIRYFSDSQLENYNPNDII